MVVLLSGILAGIFLILLAVTARRLGKSVTVGRNAKVYSQQRLDFMRKSYICIPFPVSISNNAPRRDIFPSFWESYDFSP